MGGAGLSSQLGRHSPHWLQSDLLVGHLSDGSHAAAPATEPPQEPGSSSLSQLQTPPHSARGSLHFTAPQDSGAHGHSPALLHHLWGLCTHFPGLSQGSGTVHSSLCFGRLSVPPLCLLGLSQASGAVHAGLGFCRVPFHPMSPWGLYAPLCFCRVATWLCIYYTKINKKTKSNQQPPPEPDKGKGRKRTRGHMEASNISPCPLERSVCFTPKNNSNSS